jgi:hypothetical protein
VGREENKLETEAESGLNQIEKKRYDTQIRQNKRVKKIIKICLVFWQKKAIVKYKEEEI